MPFVTYIPLKAAKALTKPVNLISVRDRWDWPEFKPTHNRLDVCYSVRMSEDDPHAFSDKIADEILAFVQSVPGQDIYVHCGEGRMRSPAIAVALQRVFGFDLNESVPGCIGHTGLMESYTYNMLRRRAKTIGVHQ